MPRTGSRETGLQRRNVGTSVLRPEIRIQDQLDASEKPSIKINHFSTHGLKLSDTITMQRVKLHLRETQLWKRDTMI